MGMNGELDRDHSGSSGIGLERSCGRWEKDWLRHTPPVGGVELLAARFRGCTRAYRAHRHDTYAIGLTERGVQVFDYRGATYASTPGNVVVLHPDEAHDGRAGTDAGFGYRQLYVEPAVVFDAVRALRGSAGALPCARQPVTTNATLAAAVRAAFRHPLEPTAIDDLVVRLAEGLLEADPSAARTAASRQFDLAAIERARQFLAAEQTRVVRSSELEAVTGLTRYELARQFRAIVGTSPYRYSLMRRLELARTLVARRRPLADIALAAGFADQAHFTRMFSAAFGMPPARYRALTALA